MNILVKHVGYVQDNGSPINEYLVYLRTMDNQNITCDIAHGEDEMKKRVDSIKSDFSDLTLKVNYIDYESHNKEQNKD